MIQEIGTIGKIKISKELKKQIDFLHKKVGATEWSGILLYKFKKGSIQKMKDLIFEANNLYLMDIGSTAATSFEYEGEDIVDMYTDVDGAMESQIGLIHTHHSMGAFHSSTDMKELEENSGKYNYYISLVVDFKEEYKCKIGFPSKTTQTLTNYIRNNEGKIVKVTTTKEIEVILLGDLEIELPSIESPKKYCIDRYDQIIEKKKANAAKQKAKEDLKSNLKGSENLYPNQGFYRGYNYRSDNKSFSQELNEKRESLHQKFAVSLIAMDMSDQDMSFKDVIDLFLDIDEEWIEMYFDTIEPQIEIIHDNTYGVDQIYLLNIHLQNVINMLKVYEKESRVKKLIGILKQYELELQF